MINYEEMADIAANANLGTVRFETRIALNTSKPIEVGYVIVDSKKSLFCKKPSDSNNFYLCNEYRSLKE